MIPARRLRSIGWVALIGLCAALLVVLSFRVNALKSQVRLAENSIVSLKRQKLYLETEFETRASQQQLKAWNDVEFGYAAPTAGQYLENERQLAALGKPAGPDAPRPIRVASADDSVAAAAAFPAMVNPLTGKSADDSASDDDKPAKSDARVAAGSERTAARSGAGASLDARLGKIERPRRAATTDDADEGPARSRPADRPAPKPAAKAPAKAKKDTRQ